MVAANLRASFDGLAEGANADTDIGINGANGGTEPKARAAAALRGAMGVGFEGGAGSSWLPQNVDGAQGTVVAQQYFSYNGTPPGTALDFLLIRNATANAANARLTPAGLLLVNDAAGTTRMTTGSALPVGSYVITIAVTKGTTTTNGRLGAWLRKVSDDTLVVASIDLATVNTGTADLTTVRHGRTGSGGKDYTADELAVAWGTFGEIDRVSSVTMSAGPDQSGVEPYTTVTLDSSTSTGSTARTWTQTSGTAVTLSSTTAAAPTFTAPGTLTGAALTFRVTDDASGVYDEVTVTVLPSARRVKLGGVMVPVQRRVTFT